MTPPSSPAPAMPRNLCGHESATEVIDCERCNPARIGKDRSPAEGVSGGACVMDPACAPEAAERIIDDVLNLDPTDYDDADDETIRVSVPDLRGIIERHLATAEPARGEVEAAKEMRDALREIGIFRSDEVGDDGSEWCVTLEPRGEEPAGTLGEALERTLEAAREDGRRERDEERETATRTERLKMAEARAAAAEIEQLNAFVNGALWEVRNRDAQSGRSIGARRVARRRGAQKTYPEAYRAWSATLPHVDEAENCLAPAPGIKPLKMDVDKDRFYNAIMAAPDVPEPPGGMLPLYCPECDHPTAANGMCFRCHPVEGASAPYETHPCDYRTTKRHSPWCPWADRNGTSAAAPGAGDA